MRPSRTALVLAALGLAAGCSSSSGTTSTPEVTQQPTATSPSASSSTENLIRIAGFGYSKLSVAAGATVTVANADPQDHTVTSVTKGLFGVTAEQGTPVTFTAPTKPGSYAFVCSIHPSMHGTLTVTG